MDKEQILAEYRECEKCKHHENGYCTISATSEDVRYRSCGEMFLNDCYFRLWKRAEAKIKKARAYIHQYNGDDVLLDIDEILE